MHTSHTYHNHIGVIEGALQCSIMGSGSDSPFGQHYLYPVSPYLLSSQLPHIQLNAISHHHLATQVVHLLFLSFYWLSSACSCYLHSNNGYQTIRISSSLIDVYLIAFRTHIDISPTFLSLLVARSWCPFGTYPHIGDLFSNKKGSATTNNYMLQEPHGTLTIYEGG